MGLEEENASLRSAIMLLHRIASLVRSSVEIEATCYALLTGVTAGVGLGLNRAMLFLIDDEDRRFLRGAAAVGPASHDEADRIWRSIKAAAPDLETLNEAGLQQREHPGPLDQKVRALRVPIDGTNPLSLALRGGAAVQAEGDDDLGGLLHLPTSVAAPLRGRSEVRGVLYGDNRFTNCHLNPVSQLVFSLLADHAGSAIEIARQFERVAEKARTDALTGLAHHGTLMEELGRAASLALASSQPLGVVMVDLDDFKRVNDTLGHLVGDALLAGIAARLRAVVRNDEAPYRYGGEEFTIILPGADREAAMAVGERLRSAVGSRAFEVGCESPIEVTCSIGVASLPQDGQDAQSVVAAADEALLEAKARGKDRICAAR